MPSSTSSSEAKLRAIHRDVPERPWLRMAAATLLLNVLALAAWEAYVRSLGYEADYDDTPGLWVEQRARAVGAGRDQLVLVGASRTLFDLDLDVLQTGLGGPRPIQLATVGSNPAVILHDLAEDPSYAGTTLVGVVPPLLAMNSGPPIENPKRFVRKYHDWSPANSWERALTRALEARFAFIQQDDLSLKQLVDHLPVPKREGAYAPELPPHFSQIDLERRTRMTVRAERDTALMQRIQQIWIPLFSGPPKPEVFSDDQWAKIFADGWTSILTQLKDDIRRIEQRGGRVFFVRDPATGTVLELEDEFASRTTHWERLLRETGAPGIHFQDHPELRSFDCPEWSHLTASDSVEYTRRLVAILERTVFASEAGDARAQ